MPLSPTCVKPQAACAQAISTTRRLLRLPRLRRRIFPIPILLTLIPAIRWGRRWRMIPVMSIIMMFHHHRRRRCRCLLTSQAAHHHHTGRNRSSHYLRSHHRLSLRTFHVRCSFATRWPLNPANNPILCAHFLHLAQVVILCSQCADKVTCTSCRWLKDRPILGEFGHRPV